MSPSRPSMLKTVLATCLLTAALTAASPALAARKPADSGRAAVAQAIADCRKVEDKDARLDCYDKAADAFDQAQAQGQVVVIDRAQAREVKRQAFGFNLPSLNLFKTGPKEETVDRVELALASAHKDLNGKWVMTTEEGAVWRQIDDTEPYRPPHAGSKMLVRTAMLGSFFCKVDGEAAMRCTRTQ